MKNLSGLRDLIGGLALILLNFSWPVIPHPT